MSQAELVEHIYAQNFDRDSNTVEVFIARLRRKLGIRPGRARPTREDGKSTYRVGEISFVLRAAP